MSRITIEVDEDDGGDLFREAQKRLARLGLNVHDAESLSLEIDGDLDTLEPVEPTTEATDEEVRASVEGKPIEAEEEVEESDPSAHNSGTKRSERPGEDEIEEVLSSSEYVTKSRVMREDGDNPYLPVLEVLFSSRDALRPDQIFDLTDGRGEGNLKRMWKNHLLDREENEETKHWYKYTLAPRGKEMILEIRQEWSREGKFKDNVESVLG